MPSHAVVLDDDPSSLNTRGLFSTHLIPIHTPILPCQTPRLFVSRRDRCVLSCLPATLRCSRCKSHVFSSPRDRIKSYEHKESFAEKECSALRRRELNEWTRLTCKVVWARTEEVGRERLAGEVQGRSHEMKERAMEGRAMEERATEGQTMEGRTMEGRAMEERAMRGQTMEGRAMEGQAIEGPSREVEGRAVRESSRDMGGRAMEGRSQEVGGRLVKVDRIALQADGRLGKSVGQPGSMDGPAREVVGRRGGSDGPTVKIDGRHGEYAVDMGGRPAGMNAHNPPKSTQHPPSAEMSFRSCGVPPTKQDVDVAQTVMSVIKNCTFPLALDCAITVRVNAFHICDAEQNLVGLALFDLLSSVNHSDDPNAIFLCKLEKGELPKMNLISLRKIQPGEEICISYVTPSMSRLKRCLELTQHRGVPCQNAKFRITNVDGMCIGMDLGELNEMDTRKAQLCAAASLNKRPLLVTFFAQQDIQPIATPDEIPFDDPAQLELVRRAIRGINLQHQAEKEFALNEISRAMSLAKESLQSFQDILGPFHEERAATLSVLSRACVQSQNWSLAYSFEKQIVAIREHTSPSHDLDLALSRALALKLLRAMVDDSRVPPLPESLVQVEEKQLAANTYRALMPLFGPPHACCGQAGIAILHDLGFKV